MTVSAQTPRSGPYSGNGSTTAFEYGFFVKTDAEIVVTVADAAGAETVKTLTTDYTVSGAGNATGIGGTVTFVTAPVSTEKVAITRIIAMTQDVDLQNRKSVVPAVLETAYDKLTRITQDHKEQLSRTAKVDLFGTTSLAALTVNLNTLAAIAPAITTVAGISSDVTTVAGIAANVTTVAGIAANVTAVAGISADVTGVQAIAANVTTVAGIAANVTTVAGISADVTGVQDIAANVTAVAGVAANVTTVAGIAPAVSAVAIIDTAVSAVAAIDTEVTTVAGVAANVTTVAGISSDVTGVQAIAANVTTVAGISANVTTVAGVAVDVTTVAGVSANVTTVAGISADVTTVAGIAAAVVGAEAQATAAADSATAAALTLTNFDKRYLGAKASDPTLDNQGDALATGALYFNTTTDSMRVYEAGGPWVAAYIPTSGTLQVANNLSDLNNPTTSRSNLGVAIGTDVQAQNAKLAALAALNATTGIVEQSGANTFARVAKPAGALVGTTATQTLLGKTITNLILDGSVTEEVFAVTGTTPALDPANGTIQTWTLSGASTPTESFAAGESLTIMIDDGTANAITWPTITWVNNGAAAPTLATSGYTVIVLWKVSSTLYGALVGSGA